MYVCTYYTLQMYTGSDTIFFEKHPISFVSMSQTSSELCKHMFAALRTVLTLECMNEYTPLES